MSSKSRRRGKHSFKSKKRRRDMATATVAPQQPTAVAPRQPTTLKYQPAAPPIKAPAPTMPSYSYVSAELRRIGMLAGILLTTLVVLNLVLS